MKKCIFLFLCLWLSQLSYSQTCTRLNDIIQIQNNDNTSASYVGAGQSWVANCSGQIESIAVRTQFVISTVQARIFIIEGTPTNLVSILKDFNYTFQGNFNVGRQFIIDIPNLLDVTAGVEYSFVIVQDDSDNSISLQFSDNNPYANGNYRYQQNPGDSWVSVTSSDLDFDILVKDDQPTINCRDITLTLDENGEASTTFGALTSSSGDDLGVAIRTISQTNFTCADIGDNQVTLVIQDSGGQNNACQATVTVVDDTPVQRGSCFGDLNYGANTDNCGYVFTYDPTTFFSDNCDITIERTSGLASGSEFPLGTTTITHVATDNNGNTVTCSFDVEIRDETAPTVSDPGDINFSVDPGACSYTYIYDASTFFSDTCDPNITIVQTAGLPSGSQFPLGQTLITHTATDAAGNVATSSFTVTVLDDEAPTVTCPNNIAVGISGSETSAVVNYNLPTATDNCSAEANITITQTAGLASGSSFPIGETTNTFQVEDEYGNINQCSFTITVSTPETSVDLINGALTINDIGGGTSDDDISFSSDGTTLTISNLTSPVEVTGGPVLTDATTVTIPLANITAGITLEAQGGTNGITFSNDLTLTGTSNNVTINDITNYTQSGAINIEGIFTIANSSNADIVVNSLATKGLSITGVNSINDVNNSNIEIDGDTTLECTGTLTMDKTINGSHIFRSLVNLEGSQITFIGTGTTDFGTVISTDGTAGVVNLLRIRSGAINFTGAVQTAGASELALQSFSNITQSGSSSITTDVLTLSKSGNFTAGSNDIKLLESAENTNLGFVFLTDVNDIEIGRLSTDDFNITATTVFISENTEITQTGSGTSNFNGNIDVTSSSATDSAIINQNAGTITFTGTNLNLVGRLEYNGASGTTTNLIGDTIGLPFGGPGVSVTFGFLNVEGDIFVGDTFCTILNEATFSGATTLLRGIGTLGGTTIIESDATIQPGGGTETYSITTGNLEINGASFAPLIESNSSRDLLEANGTVTLTNAAFSPVGGFTAAPTTDEIVLIENDDTDAVNGTFLNYPEGSAVIVSGYAFTITYLGGDGNDVALNLDSENPTAICQDITVTVTPDIDATVNASDIDNGSSDNTGIDQLLIEGSASIAFTFADIGSYNVTLTVSDANGNNSQCTATITVVSGINNTLPVLINEFQPTLSGVIDQTIEILGTPGETFAGYIVVVEGDVDSASVGVVRSAEVISGTFDSNGLFTATIPLIITPSHTVILTNSFTGTVDVTDIDTDDNQSRTADNLADFGQIFDAIGIVDEDLDVGNTYGSELGGVDVANISNLARLAFRDALTNDWYVTDASGNIYNTSANTIASASFNTDPTAGTTFGTINPFITPTETTVDLTNGTLTITDVNGGTSDDDIMLSSDGTTLTISNLVNSVAVSGGPTLSDATTVTVPIASITNGIIFNAEGGTNGINFSTALALTGVDNNITLNNITNYTQASSIDIGGIFTIANSPNADIVFDALTATGLSVTNVNSIADNTIGSTSVFRIEGDTTLQATNTIVIDDAAGSSNEGNAVAFPGTVAMEASRITFVAFGNSTFFQDITATDATLGVNSIRIRSGNINFRGNVQTAGASQLQLDAFGSISQNDESTITTDVLSLDGRNNGSTRAVLGGDNDIRVLETLVSFREVTLNDINDVIIGNLTVTEFDITTNSGTIFLTEETILTKTGTDISYFNGDMEVDSNSTNPVINHDAGTITCTGANLSLFGNLTYNGLTGTTTEFLSTDTDLSTTDITIGGSTASLTFGNLNVTGVFFAIPQTSITIENEATFTGTTTALQGFSTSSITGGPITITNGALLQPGNAQTTSSLITDDVTIDGGSFAPHINSGTDYSFMTIQGAVTLNNATFTPVGDFITLPSNSNELILIENDDTDAIVGTFLNYPEGSSIEVGGIPFTISYVGGDGNDFSLVKNNESGFITSWQTTTANESITIPTFLGETYDYIVDWGDGDIDYGITGDATHSYATAGTYTVTIFGTFSRIIFDGNAAENREKLISIDQWGDNPWTSLEFSFTDCINMDLLATDTPNLSNVTSLRAMFDGCQTMVANASINNWDVSTIQDMSFLFNQANNFNQPLTNWNVSNVTSMAFMFSAANSFNQPLNSWNVSSVISFAGMFDNADSFNQPLNDWNVSNAESMTAMFRRTDNFNQPLNNWNVSSVQNMTFMFRDAAAFDQPLGSWDVSNIQSAVLLLTGSAFSDTNYDDLLINWSQLNLQSGVSFATDVSYCLGAAARQRMITNNNWSIADGGSNCSVSLSPKVYLQGATLNPNTGEENLMRDDLRVAGFIPTTSPYSDGLTCEATVFDTTGDNAIVDWVWIELRDATDNTFVIVGQSALLQRDGDVVATDGTSALSLDTSDDNYYVSVQHRNHLGILSTSSIALSEATATTVDFTNGSTTTLGSNAQTDFGMPSGITGMWTGNVNDDTIVQYSGTTPDTPAILSEVLNDPGNFLNFPTFTISGYNNNDVNMDGNTQYSGTNPDSPLILQNVLAHPGNFLNFSTYQIIEQLPEN